MKMYKIIECDGIKNHIKLIKIIANYEKALKYALALKEKTGKRYIVTRV